MRIVFWGTPLFAANILRDIFQSKVCSIVAVVSKPDKPQGRSSKPQPTAVKMMTSSLLPDVPIFQPSIASDSGFASVLKELNPDLFVVVAYGEIIKQIVLDVPKIGCVNIHASLLPYYRGAAPIQRCIMNGDVETGVSIIEMVRKMDAGAILNIEKVKIDPDDTFKEVEEKLCCAGSRCIIQVIQDFKEGKVSKKEQDETQATFAPKIQSEDCIINWNQPALVIHNQVRALSPNPGAWTWLNIKGERKRLHIKRAFRMERSNIAPRTFFVSDRGDFGISCQDGALILLEVQLEGKKVMQGKEFLRGISLEECFIESINIAET